MLTLTLLGIVPRAYQPTSCATLGAKGPWPLSLRRWRLLATQIYINSEATEKMQENASHRCEAKFSLKKTLLIDGEQKFSKTASVRTANRQTQRAKQQPTVVHSKQQTDTERQRHTDQQQAIATDSKQQHKHSERVRWRGV